MSRDRDAPRNGLTNAAVTIVECGEFECPLTDRARDFVTYVLQR